MNATDFIGKLVLLRIDRPAGCVHPRHGFSYPVNYGFVPDTVSGDGEELDAYVLGVTEPLTRFEGRCIAVVHRRDDDDDKLVVVPEGVVLSREAIRAAVDFQERYFESEIILVAAGG